MYFVQMLVTRILSGLIPDFIAKFLYISPSVIHYYHGTFPPVNIIFLAFFIFNKLTPFTKSFFITLNTTIKSEDLISSSFI